MTESHGQADTKAKRQPSSLISFGDVSPEMRAAGASALCAAADDLFGNGSVGFRRAEGCAVAVFLAMSNAVAENEFQKPETKRIETRPQDRR